MQLRISSLKCGKFKLFVALILCFSTYFFNAPVYCRFPEDIEHSFLSPTVFISILARNKAHTLPYFLGYLEKLNYPKSRISLWIKSDHNVDETANELRTWLNVYQHEYHSVEISVDASTDYFTDEKSVFDWSPQHFDHVINTKEKAMEVAKRTWADFIWFLDCDVFITNSNTLNLLIQERKTIISPMVESLGAYSNFWCGVTEQGYYKRTEDYLPILEREKIGCFDVPMIHSAVLIDLRKKIAHDLSFDPKKITNYSGPNDDIIAFANSAKLLDIKMYILNTEPFGYLMVPLEKGHSLQDDGEQLRNLKIEMMVDGPPMSASPTLLDFVHVIDHDTIGLDEVYLINLLRRPSRRQRMLLTLEEMGVKAYLIDAVDGEKLNESKIEDLGIKMLPEYLDPYHKRPLTKGEIGCFLSHYSVWKDMIAKQHRTALVLEDDIRFEAYFKKKLHSLLKEAQKIGLLWDLIYLGRKRLSEDNEPYVHGSTSFVHVDYSYWTLCYLITLEGAKKLVGANPLSKMVPVDEYLPIMFDRHPEITWKGYYTKRNLKAYSAHPLLVYPTHYTGEPDYVSDTEESTVMPSLAFKDEL